MKINQNNIKNIELCYENCEVDTIESVNYLAFKLQEKINHLILIKNNQLIELKPLKLH